ncbi:MAG: right-handed parallel beta-helix repeat-containing protein [Planctomycetes bacterium]|nr:right-handed parallel beta-helix repeat-containing protein [Planctomycetota bacterium]MCC7169005.1 right-handed parallel beta-helix repeat-containing protein [Planctomycetota bacterium]
MKRFMISLVMTSFGVALCAHGATHVVSPTGALNSISGAVAIATPGDTILIKPGVYRDFVAVPPGLDDLRFVGSKGVVCEPRDANTGAPTGPFFKIAADRITVKNLTVRHAAESMPATGNGIGIGMFGNDCVVEGVTFIDCRDTGLDASFDRPTIRKCVFRDCGIAVVVGNQGLLESCTFTRCVRGVDAGGNGIVVRKSKFTEISAAGPGVRIVGSTALVETCALAQCEGGGISVDGSGTIRNNKLTSVLGAPAIDLQGSGSFLVEKNSITGAQTQAIQSVANATTVRKNVVKGSALDAFCISIGGPASIVESNTVLDGGRFGLFCPGSSTNAIVVKNVVRRAGYGAGVLLLGAGSTFNGNTVQDCGGDGLAVGADGAQIVGNSISGNTIDGIDIDNASSVFVSGNKVTGNGAEGIEVGAAGTATVSGNVVLKNRIDLANAGAGTFNANTFGTGGSSALPQID